MGEKWANSFFQKFFKSFSKVDIDDDFLLAFELWYSKTMDNTGRPNGSVKIGTFPLHTETCPLHTGIFFAMKITQSKEHFDENYLVGEKQGVLENGEISTFSYIS